MAGVNMANDEDRETGKANVPTIGGKEYRSSIGLSPEAVQAQVAASAHLTDGPRAEGVPYDSNNSIGVNLDTGAYPAPTSFPGDHGAFG